MKWNQLILSTTAKQADICADLLLALGADAISFTDAQDKPVFQLQPNETPLWNKTKVLGLFSQDIALDNLLLSLQTQATKCWDKIEVHYLMDEDWVRKTQQNFPPQCFANGLWVIPSWLNKSPYPDPKIIIDPGLAFGTGTHPTTILCLEWLVANRPTNKVIVDYGCGSGILSIAALALGAKHIYAIDHDQQALEATQNNMQLNTTLSKKNLTITTPAALGNVKASQVIANILSSPLLELKETFDHLCEPYAQLVLSGILENESAKIAAYYQTHFTLTCVKQQQEWMLMSFNKKS